MLISGLEVLQAILFKIILDTAAGNYSIDFATLVGYVAVFLFAVLVLETLSRTSDEALIAKIMKDYRQDIIDKYLSLESQVRVPSAKLISIMTNELNEIEKGYLKSMISIFKDIFLFVISICLLFSISIYLAVSIVLIAWLPILLPQLFNSKNQRLKGEYLKNIEKYTNKVREISQGFELIKGFNIESKISSIFSVVNIKTEHSKFVSNSFMSFQGAVSIVSGFLMFFINVLIATYLVINGRITIGSMVASIQLMNYIVNPIISISKYTAKMKSVKKVIASINTMTVSGQSECSKANKTFEFDRDITLRHLTYSYDGNKRVISNFNYVFKKGKKYAIVGESGCGKTTLLKILMRQIVGYQGDIDIDGNSIHLISPSDYYKKVTLIHQHTFIFNDTLKNNICLYNDFADDKFYYALKKAGLNKIACIHNKGIEMVIGEGHVELSGGEQKRVSIARGLIRDAELLLIDEATSALDNKTAHAIENSLINLEATIIAISHRLDKQILSRYDAILFMKNGTIVESGRFDDLLDQKGYFYQLYNYEIERAKV